MSNRITEQDTVSSAVLPREPAVEAALVWAEHQAYAGAHHALDSYCASRRIDWTDTWQHGITFKVQS